VSQHSQTDTRRSGAEAQGGGGAAPAGAAAAMTRDATLGCVTQLTAMVNLLRDNLSNLSSEPAAPAAERTNVTKVVKDALADIAPLSRTSRVTFVPAIGEDLFASVDSSRCGAPPASQLLCPPGVGLNRHGLRTIIK
jgi:hypothetical protein